MYGISFARRIIAQMKAHANGCRSFCPLGFVMLEQARAKVSAMSLGEKVDAAKSKDSSDSMLTVLGKDDNRVVRSYVAQNENTPVGVLATIARNDRLWVRGAVAGSSTTPGEVLAILAEDNDWQVRGAVAENLSTDPDVLVALSDDTDEDVSEAAMRNPSLPLSRILELAYHRHYHQRIRIVDNLSLPYEDLLLMLSDRSKKVRQRAEEVLRKRNDPARLD